MKWFVKCIKNYVNFTGRARRSEYWFFVLFEFIFLMAAMILDLLFFGEEPSTFYYLTALFFFLPQLAVSVRRLHDTGHSGTQLLLYYLAAIIWVVVLIFTGLLAIVASGGSIDGMTTTFLVALIGGCFVFTVWGIFFLVWFCSKGTDGDNKYGPDPMLDEK